jgi:hypothetical protein
MGGLIVKTNNLMIRLNGQMLMVMDLEITPEGPLQMLVPGPLETQRKGIDTGVLILMAMDGMM